MSAATYCGAFSGPEDYLAANAYAGTRSSHANRVAAVR